MNIFPKLPSGQARPIVIGSFVSSIGNGMFLPFLPIWIIENGLSTEEAGILLAIAAGARMGLTLLGGSLADAWEPIPVVSLGVLLAVLGCATLAVEGLAFNLTLVGLLLLSGSAMGGPPLSAVLVSTSCKSALPQIFGSMYAFNNLGMALGSGVAGLAIFAETPRGIMATINALSFIAFFIAVRTLRRIPYMTPDSREDSLDFYPVSRSPALSLAILCLGYTLVCTFGFAQQETGVALILPVEIEGATIIGASWAGNCLVVVLMQQWGVQMCSNRGVLYSIRLGIVIMTISLAFTAAAIHLSQGLWVVAGLTTFGIGEVLLSPAVGTFLNQTAHESHRARANAWLGVASAAGRAVGPVFSSQRRLSLLGWAVIVGVGLTLGALAINLSNRFKPVVARRAAPF